MGRRIRRTLTFIVLLVFLGSVGFLVYTQQQNRSSSLLYEQALKDFTSDMAEEDVQKAQEEIREIPPIEVDFESIQRTYGNVIGWIYCEGTVINYPVVQGTDNAYYLKHAYDGTYTTSGSIFIDCDNKADFSDSNTIIYGHHMRNKTMFAPLGSWEEQSFYEEHPVIWLLTPEQDYKIVLFSAYTTSSKSETYTIFEGPSEELNFYLQNAAAKSKFQTEIMFEEGERYVTLSTCSYAFDNARSVLHGKLIPL